MSGVSVGASGRAPALDEKPASTAFAGEGSQNGSLRSCSRFTSEPGKDGVSRILVHVASKADAGASGNEGWCSSGRMGSVSFGEPPGAAVTGTVEHVFVPGTRYNGRVRRVVVSGVGVGDDAESFVFAGGGPELEFAGAIGVGARF